jgi:hypothetical protein
MQDVTHVSPLAAAYQVAIQSKADALLADAAFINGFQAGIEAYLDNCGDSGRALTNDEAADDVHKELAPSARQRQAQAFCLREYGIVADPLFDSGFLAGWIVAHKTALTDLDVSLPETCPLGVVVPFRSCEHQETLCS